MLPVIAIVGRPNVGKSTLFNCLTKSRDALVADMPGLTRDRHYGQGKVGNQAYIVVDTGGIGEINNAIEELMAQQAKQAIKEADVVLFVTDGRSGLTAADREIAKQLRRLNKQTWLVVNKAEGLDVASASSEFYALGFQHVAAISAAHGQGIEPLIKQVLTKFNVDFAEAEAAPLGIRVAIVGRPNVGKSTLVNRLFGEERVLAFDQPGTTRDSIDIPLEHNGKQYVFIDTAGIRRKGRVFETIEKFSVVKALQAVESANVVLMLMDAREGVTEQDLNLLGFVLETGKALVIAVNKWDGLQQDEREQVKRELQRRLVFIDFASPYFISALHGTGVGGLYNAIDSAYESATRKLSTSVLTRILLKATEQHQPPLVQGRRVKLRFAHPGGSNPPLIIIHGKQTEQLPRSYLRYLAGTFRRVLKLVGTPVRLEFKTDANPYAENRRSIANRRLKKTSGKIKKNAV